MSAPGKQFAVMFADVCGSTRLYETLGDAGARALVGDVLTTMAAVTHQHFGIVVKTIGDEIMSRFEDAESGVCAAMQIQDTLGKRQPLHDGTRVSVRIGVHWGPAILDNEDLFGDAVNIASRMAGIAKPRQVITTEDTVRMLSKGLAQKARFFDRTQVKGRQGEIAVHEVLWEAPAEVTLITAVRTALPAELLAVRPLIVRCGRAEKTVPHNGRSFVMGRADECDLVVNAPMASRQHARIEYRRGKYILSDQSTNGTWVRMQDGNRVFLKREELPLWGAGSISLADNVRKDDPFLVHFRIAE